jgi:uncharacterized protein YgiM (DUF1202 family)
MAKLNSSNVNFRSQPSTDGDVLGKLTEGTEAKVLETGAGSDGSWSKVKINDKEGYVSTQFLTRSTPAPAGGYIARLTTSNVNFREQPSTDGKVLGKLSKNTEATVLETGLGDDSGWSKVNINGTEGYVASMYLTKP